MAIRKLLKKASILRSIILIMIVSLIAIKLLNQPALPSVAAVDGLRVGIYWDEECTREVQTIDWGLSQPGESETVSVFLKNEWNTPILLSLNTTDWAPTEAAGLISFNWDYNRQKLNIGDITPVTFILTVDIVTNGITSFSFKAQIVGEEVPSSPPSMNESNILRGDANMDGLVSIADAMFISQYLIGSRPASDINILNAASVKHDLEGDQISIADAMFIAQYLVDLRDESYELR